MTKVEHLTVGIVAQNGSAQLSKCLDSLPPLSDCAQSVEFILVDSASTDSTLEQMSEFSASRTDTRVYSMQGKVNLSATRNVVLDHANPGAVFLVDGDVAINRNFVVSALEEIDAGNADLFYGQLPEVWHTADHVPYAEAPDRYAVPAREYKNRHMGLVLFSPVVLADGNRYDEVMRRFEDFEFSVRMADRYRILALPVAMGVHYTIHYYSAGRIRDFYRNAYQRPAGQFIRKNLFSPDKLWRARDGYSGDIVGLVEQLLLVVSLLIGDVRLIAVAGLLLAADFAKFFHQGRPNEFLPLRIVGAWQILYGFFFPEELNVSYQVRLVSDGVPGSESESKL